MIDSKTRRFAFVSMPISRTYSPWCSAIHLERNESTSASLVESTGAQLLQEPVLNRLLSACSVPIL